MSTKTIRLQVHKDFFITLYDHFDQDGIPYQTHGFYDRHGYYLKFMTEDEAIAALCKEYEGVQVI